MARTYIRVVRLGKWFPPGDPLAASIARLVILREDLMLELSGILAGAIKELDENSEQWRRTYFLRNSVRTLWEIQGALTTIRMRPEFKRILKRRPQREQTELSQICARLNAAATMIRKIRNSLGGHVLPEAVTKALDSMAYDRWGVLEVGSVIKTTHFKMAGELVAEILVDGVPENQKLSKLEADIRTLADLLPVVERLRVRAIMWPGGNINEHRPER